jgi:hypothetical protein
VASRPFAPRIVLIDIESSPALGWTWQRYEADVLKCERDWELLSFAYKELGRQPTRVIARPDFRDKTDRGLTQAAWKVLDEADVVVGHNLDKFDVRKLKAKFVEHGLAPPRTFKTIDTLKIARQQFAFSSNRLNDLAATLKLGSKVKTGGVGLWFDCLAGCKKAWAKMRRYNAHDVVLLERVYEKLKSWYPSHPNLALYEDRPGCPVCSSLKVQRRGWRVNLSRKVPRFQCQDCGHWMASAQLAKDLAA